MNETISRIGYCIERGKINRKSSYPRDLNEQDGADELACEAIKAGADPEEILTACGEGMHNIGEKFSRNQAFVPELLMSAKAMEAVMVHLKPFFQAGTVKVRGQFIIGTVTGDLHDIGKNLVSMVVEGNGWQVIDLGVNVASNKFLEAVQKYPDAVVGLSALLTTTMSNMVGIIKELKSLRPDTKIIVGGAPLSKKFADEIGADGYAANPQEAVDWLNSAVCA